MSSITDSLTELAATVARSLPCGDDLMALPDAELTASLGVLGGIRDQVNAVIALGASDIDRRSARDLGTSGLAQRNGAKDGAALVQQLTGVSRGEASKAIRVGVLLEQAQAVAPVHEDAAAPTVAPVPLRSLEALAALPGPWDAPLAVAVRNRWLSADQGDALKSGLGRPRDDASAPGWREAVLRLIGDCWDGAWTAEELRRAAQTARATLDRLWAQQNAGRLRELRSATRRVDGDGMVRWNLRLDPETDAKIWTPLYRRLSPRLGGPRFLTEEEQARAAELEADVRSNEQLLADELTDLVIAGVEAQPKRFGQYVPRVNVAVTAAELRRAEAAQGALERHHAGDHTLCPRGAGAGSVAPVGAFGQRECPGPDVGVAWLQDSQQPITALEALRMLCTGEFTATLFDESGRAIDSTRDERTFSAVQRTALALRDGGCMGPGCDAPASSCEAHHINPWSELLRNRVTETRDGILLCRRCHLLLHNHGARITRDGDTYWWHWPGREPRRLHSRSGARVQLRASGATPVARPMPLQGWGS